MVPRAGAMGAAGGGAAAESRKRRQRVFAKYKGEAAEARRRQQKRQRGTPTRGASNARIDAVSLLVCYIAPAVLALALLVSLVSVLGTRVLEAMAWSSAESGHATSTLRRASMMMSGERASSAAAGGEL